MHVNILCFFLWVFFIVYVSATISGCLVGEASVLDSGEIGCVRVPWDRPSNLGANHDGFWMFLVIYPSKQVIEPI